MVFNFQLLFHLLISVPQTILFRSHHPNRQRRQSRVPERHEEPLQRMGLRSKQTKLTSFPTSTTHSIVSSGNFSQDEAQFIEAKDKFDGSLSFQNQTQNLILFKRSVTKITLMFGPKPIKIYG